MPVKKRKTKKFCTKSCGKGCKDDNHIVPRVVAGIVLTVAFAFVVLFAARERPSLVAERQLPVSPDKVTQEILNVNQDMLAQELENSLVEQGVLSDGSEESDEKMVDLNSLQIEIASTKLEKIKGLSGRDSLAADAGMLFMFDDSDIYPFWMKGMEFPIDIVWMENGTVVEVASLPAPIQGDDDVPRYIPVNNADTVLELNAGMAEKLGLKPGAKVNLE